MKAGLKMFSRVIGLSLCIFCFGASHAAEPAQPPQVNSPTNQSHGVKGGEPNSRWTAQHDLIRQKYEQLTRVLSDRGSMTFTLIKDANQTHPLELKKEQLLELAWSVTRLWDYRQAISYQCKDEISRSVVAETDQLFDWLHAKIAGQSATPVTLSIKEVQAWFGKTRSVLEEHFNRAQDKEGLAPQKRDAMSALEQMSVALSGNTTELLLSTSEIDQAMASVDAIFKPSDSRATAVCPGPDGGVSPPVVPTPTVTPTPQPTPDPTDELLLELLKQLADQQKPQKSPPSGGAPSASAAPPSGGSPSGGPQQPQPEPPQMPPPPPQMPMTLAQPMAMQPPIIDQGSRFKDDRPTPQPVNPLQDPMVRNLMAQNQMLRQQNQQMMQMQNGRPNAYNRMVGGFGPRGRYPLAVQRMRSRFPNRMTGTGTAGSIGTLGYSPSARTLPSQLMGR